MINDYTIYDEIGRVSNDRALRSLYRSKSSHVFWQCLRLISGACMLEVNETHHKCGIGISSIFDTVFRCLPIFLTVLRYWVPPNVPLITP